MQLQDFGWQPCFESVFQAHEAPGFLPGRVITESREQYRLATAAGELEAELAGRLRYLAESREELPAVGDWVVAQAFPGEGTAVVHAVLPRESRLARRAAGERTEVQIVGANIDTVFLVTSLNQDFNPRRLERYLAAARDGGCRPVVVLSKADLHADPGPFLERVAAVAGGAPALAVSALTGAGLEALAPYLEPGRTVALLGSSGVGKSTLVNRLAGEDLQAVREIRAGDGRGRHATTRRQLFPLPGGALLLDTPGMRELGLWSDGEGVAEAFEEIEELAASCRFRDCRHRGEPGCAVLRAVEEGDLDAARLASYEKLAREEEHLRLRREVGAAQAEKRRWKAMMAGANPNRRKGIR